MKASDAAGRDTAFALGFWDIQGAGSLMHRAIQLRIPH